MGPLTGRPLPPLRHGVGPLLVLVLETWVRVNLILPALLANALLPFSIKLSLLQNSGGCTSTSTQQRCGRLVPQWWPLGGVQCFLPTREQAQGSLYLCSLLMWYPGHGCSLSRPLMRAASSMPTSSVGTLVEHPWKWSTQPDSWRTPTVGAHHLKWYHWKKKHTIPSSHTIWKQTSPKGMVDPA